MAGELRDRAHGKTVEKTEQAAQLAEQQAEQFSALSAQLKAMHKAFQTAMPKGTEAAQLIRDAQTVLRQDPYLLKCGSTSILGGLMTIAQLGLRPGVLGQAWLVPFWDTPSGQHQAQVIVGYKGYVALAYRSEQIGGIIARTVFQNDKAFEVQYGSEDKLIHLPGEFGGDRGKPLGYYSVVHIKGGRSLFNVMSKLEVEAHRDRYAKKNKAGEFSKAWRDNFEPMAWKTTFRGLARWVPQSPELMTAMVIDDGVRINSDPTIAPEEATYHVEQVPSAGGDQ